MLGGRTLVDTSNWSAEVLVINPGSDVVVLPPFSCVGDVVQVSVRCHRSHSGGPSRN